MHTWCSALVLPGARPEEVEEALDAFAGRDDVEPAPPGLPPTLAGELLYDDAGTRLEMDGPRGPGKSGPLLDFARTIAAECNRPVKVLMVKVERLSPDATALHYEAFDVSPAGEAASLRLSSVDAFLDELGDVADEHPHEEAFDVLGQLVLAALPQGGGHPIPGERFAFRVRPALTDPRLADLAAQATAAATLEVTRRADGRHVLRMQTADGSRRLAVLSDEEIAQLHPHLPARSDP